jgi:hypothetical protein
MLDDLLDAEVRAYQARCGAQPPAPLTLRIRRIEAPAPAPVPA